MVGNDVLHLLVYLGGGFEVQNVSNYFLIKNMTSFNVKFLVCLKVFLFSVLHCLKCLTYI